MPAKQANGQPELPRWMQEIGHRERPDSDGDGRGHGGQVSPEIGCHQQQQGDGERADDAGQLHAGSGGLGHGRA
jgi:hypothetical protein